MDSHLDNMNCDCDCCRNELNLEKLCVKKIKACKIKVKDLELNNTLCAELLSSPKVCTGLLMADKADVNSSCMGSLNVMNQCVQNITASNIGVSNLIANEVCIPGTLRAANFLNYNKYRATVTFPALTTYTLGSYLDFNDILDDPNGNVSLSPCAYTVPVSGYYEVLLKINQQNLVSSGGTILGVPSADAQIYVNGILAREILSSFLAFYPQQKVILSSMISLRAGDLVQMKYKVIALDAINGAIEIAGTVDLLGNGADMNGSIFKIHLLSADSPSTFPCVPSVPCQPCIPQQCVPCVPKPSGSMCDSGSCSSSNP